LLALSQVSQDWDRQLLVLLLQQQLMPGSAPNPCGTPSLPTIDDLLPSLEGMLTEGKSAQRTDLETIM